MSAFKRWFFTLTVLLVTGSVTASPTTHFGLSGLFPPITSGATDLLTVTALDASNVIDTTYSGVVHFGSSDFAALLPADYAFVPLDAGAHTFSLELFTLGPQSVSVVDTVNGTIFSTISTRVVAGVPEPGTYTLVLLALGLLGGVVRRRSSDLNRRSATFAGL
jgi:hypothetical protein